jgi:integrase
MGTNEPGWTAFASYVRRARPGLSEETMEQYAKCLGMSRAFSGRPLLDLSVPEVEALDERLTAVAPAVRTTLKRFYRANRRADLDEAMVIQRKTPRRRLSADEILTPDDMAALISGSLSLRDRAIVAVLTATGGRINEVLSVRLKDIKETKDGLRLWFGHTKVKSQERYSLPIAAPWREHVDRWLAAHPRRADPEAWLFPNAVNGERVAAQTVRDALTARAKALGLSRYKSPHDIRHARVSWGVMAEENLPKLCMGIWGRPVTSMLNTYAHLTGLGSDFGTIKPRVLTDVPAMPTPPGMVSAKDVAALKAELEAHRKILDRLQHGDIEGDDVDVVE